MGAPPDALPEATRQLFRAAMQPFAGECFWNWDLSRDIATRAAARLVIRQLRPHGGKPGRHADAELVRCL